jgi:cytidylate kinase
LGIEQDARGILHGLMSALTIAIDGPSGAGKGTVARAVASELGYRHIDSGAMYRAIGWKALGQRVALDDEPAVARIAERSHIDIVGELVSIDGIDVTKAIRTPEIDRAAAATARLPKVRAALVRRQREAGDHRGIVIEGRDIGTVVFPDADVKIYLDASPEERARRRAADPAHGAGRQAGLDVEGEMKARDLSDSTRTTSPLMAAPDAVHLTTTGLSVEETLAKAMEIVREKLEN